MARALSVAVRYSSLKTTRTASGNSSKSSISRSLSATRQALCYGVSQFGADLLLVVQRQRRIPVVYTVQLEKTEVNVKAAFLKLALLLSTALSRVAGPSRYRREDYAAQ